MKSSLKILIGIVIAFALLVLPMIGTYNSLVTMNENVDAQWAMVESKLQRRFDLIPNLVESVKGIMNQEQEVFGNIADARARMAGAQTTEERVEASNELEGALGRLLVVMENYPQLRSAENVTRLMDELAGTENRISVERDRYNTVVSDYNKGIKRFPRNIMAGAMGFDAKPYFEAAAGAENAPKVDFNN